MLSDFDQRIEDHSKNIRDLQRTAMRAWIAGALLVIVGVPIGTVAVVYGVLWCLREFGLIGT